MKKSLLIAAVLMSVVIAGQAKADGFVCENVEGTLKLSVYNHVTPELGTRNAAVMVLSNPEVGVGSKTIAKFTDVHSTLSNRGARYLADVDLRFTDSSRQGELVGGTKLGNLDTISLEIDFSYADPTRDGASMPGQVTLSRRVGAEIVHDVVCTRYLKN